MRLELRLSPFEPMEWLRVVLCDESGAIVATGRLEAVVEPEAGELEPQLPAAGESVKMQLWFVGTATP